MADEQEKQAEEVIRLLRLGAEALQKIEQHLSNIAEIMLERRNVGY